MSLSQISRASPISSNQTVFPPVLIGNPDLTPCELAAKQASWGSKAKRFFKQAITYVVLASLQLGTLVQTKEAYAQYVPYGQANTGSGYVAPSPSSNSFSQTGYTNDGTLFMGGQRVANPLQFLYDSQIPGFMTITATRFTFTDNPNHGQGTLLQMSQATTAGSDSSVLLNRLYLSPTNPYVQGAPGPYPNYQTYQGVLQNAQQANFLLTNANDGKTYAFKTLTAANSQAVDLLIRELPNTPEFRAAADPLGGGTGVRVTQSGDAVALAAYLATVKPYDYSWQPNFGTTFGQNGQNPYGGWANSNNFAPDYSEGAGPAQSFQAFVKQLQDDAVASDKKVRSQTSANSLDLNNVNPNSLFGEGYNLFQYGSNSNPNRDLENDFLKRLQAGQLTVGSADYLEASRIAQERYRIAYATRLETNKPLQYSVADAQRKANELKLGDINANELFGQGFDLFKYNPALRANGAAENDLLARLQSGQLQAGSSEYQQAAEIAQQRLREAYAQSLSPPPPKKVSKWKLIAGAVVGAVLTFVTAGASLPYVAGALTSATVAATTAALATVSATVTTAAALATVGISASMTAVLTAVAGVVAGAVGAIASTSITTGNLSEGLKAGGKALVSGGVKAIVAGALGVGFATAGLSGLSGIEGTVSNIALNTLSGAVSSTILGEGSFADNLKTSAISSVVDAVGKSVANGIGDAFPNGNGTNLANYAAHAVLGCASAAAKGGDCAAGAVGAAAGEAAAATGFVNWAAAGMGQTLTDNGTVFFSGLIGGTVAAAVGSVDKVESNFATGTATATNAVTNNYLNHKDASKLAALKGQTSCDANCKTEIAALEKLDAANNKALAACEGVSNAACDGVRNDVRMAAAEYIRKNVGSLDAASGKDINTYNSEKTETIALADGTMSGKAQGAITGYANTVVDGVSALGSGMYQVGKAILGDPQAQQSVKDGAGAMWDTVKDPSNWPYLMGAMTPADREKLALAYEAGNGKAVGEILGTSVANLPIGGGGLGTIKKVGGLPNGNAVTRLDVDEYKNLTKNSPVGDGLDNHHVPQKTIAQDVVPGYPQDKTAGSAPAITLTKAEHTYITGQQNANQAARSLMNPRDLLADDARMLREIGVPNDKIQQIIELNKVKYGFNK